MKLSHGFGLLAAGFGTVGLTAFAGVGGLTACSSSSSSASSSGGGSGGGSSGGADLCASLPSGSCNDPPTKPTSGTPASTTPHNYALHQLVLGDTDRSGNPSTTAWQDFGYDLDGKITTQSSTDVCTLVAGSSKQVQVDGTKGIDNSFGSQIMPIIGTLDSTASQTLNTAIAGGSFTIMTYVVGFDDSAGNTTTAAGLTGVLLAGGKYSADGGAPAWDTTTVWPVLPDPGLITGCSATAGCPSGTDPVKDAVIQFNGAFQTKGEFVSGAPNPLTLSLSIGGQTLSLDIASAVISFDPSSPGSVTNGTIAGVLDTQDLISGLMNVAGNISTSLCSGSAFQSIAMQIEQTSDIVLNGTTVSNPAGTTCNAISIGLGFNSTEIAVPSVIAPGSPPTPSKCDGGS
jgi:hypothetical protein